MKLQTLKQTSAEVKCQTCKITPANTIKASVFFDGETVKLIDGIFAVFRHTDILCPMAERKFRKSQVAVFFQKLRGNIVEGVLILRNSSLKLKTVVDNAILRNCAVSSENISE